MDLKGHQLGSLPHFINPQSGEQNSLYDPQEAEGWWEELWRAD